MNGGWYTCWNSGGHGEDERARVGDEALGKVWGSATGSAVQACESRAACLGQLTDVTSEALFVVSVAASSPAWLPHLIVLIVLTV